MRPKFVSDRPEFSTELRRRVQEYIQGSRTSTQANAVAIVKAAVLLALFIALYLTLVLVPLPLGKLVLVSFVTGVVVVLIGLNVLHECAHGNYFRSPMANRISGYLMDIFGISVDIYRIKHIEVHHRFTNVHRWDGDLDEAYPLVRLTNRFPALFGHRYQHWYAPLLYSLVTFSWVTSDDLRRLGSMRVCDFEIPPFTLAQKQWIVGAKFLHLGWSIGIPCFFYPVGVVLAVNFGIHLVMGLGITIVFQLAHVFDRSSFEAAPVGKPGDYGDWMVHQLKTTSDFATENPWVCHLLGGLNFQVEHHLFPGVSYVHLPMIQKIVKKTCAEYGVEYHEYPTCGAAIRSHFKLLRELGRAW